MLLWIFDKWYLQPDTYLLLAAESFAGRFSHLLTVTINAFLSKLYFMVQCNVPKTWFGSTKEVEADEEARLLIPGSSEPIKGPFSSTTSARSPYISEPAPTNWKMRKFFYLYQYLQIVEKLYVLYCEKYTFI